MGCVNPHAKESAKKSLFKQQQLTLLKLMYNDLGTRAKSGKLTKENFNIFFHLNGLWGHEVFDLFDKQKKGELTLEMLVTGIQYLVKGEYKQKIQALFRFYDVDKTGGVGYSQLLKMLYSYPKEELVKMIDDEKFLAAMNAQQKSYHFGKNKQDIDISKDVVQLEIVEQQQTQQKKPRRRERLSSGVFNGEVQIIEVNQIKDKSKVQYQNKNTLPSLIVKKKQNKNKIKTGSLATFNVQQAKRFKVTSNISLLVKKYANFLFKQFNLDKETQKISLEIFEKLVLTHHRIFATYFEGFHNYIWEIDDSNIPQFITNTSWIQAQCTQFQPKSSTKRHCYLRFFKHTIFVFKSKSDNIPFDLKNMEGLFVEDFNEGDQMYGFIVKHRDGLYTQKAYLFKSKESQKQWLDQLKIFLKNSIYDLYTMDQKIGSGNYSVVYKGVQKATNKPVAVKVIQKFRHSISQKETIKQECKILDLCHHPNIVKFYQTSESKTNIYIVIELMTEGDLYEYVKKKSFLQQNQAALIMKQLFEAIMYLNSLGIIHRDLKPQNIMIKINKQKQIIQKVKLIDFGFAIYKDSIKHLPPILRFAGTPNFLSPQVLQCQDYDEKVDNFSLGVILYWMLSGLLPFDSIFDDQITTLTIKCQLELQNAHWSNVSTNGKDLISKLIALRENRISLEEAIQHPWITEMQELKQQTGKNKKNKF